MVKAPKDDTFARWRVTYAGAATVQKLANAPDEGIAVASGRVYDTAVGVLEELAGSNFERFAGGFGSFVSDSSALKAYAP